MVEDNNSNIRKKQRLKIKNIHDFQQALRREGYSFSELEVHKLKTIIKKEFNIDDFIIKRIYEILYEDKVTYKVENVTNFIEYVENIEILKKEHKKLESKINRIENLCISRVEYEREISTKDNVQDIIDKINIVRDTLAERMNKDEITIIQHLEKELDKEQIYTKDVELLKKILTSGHNNKLEVYNNKTKVKTILIQVPKEITYDYISTSIGSVEYHYHVKNNIPRIKRLNRSIHKYLEIENEDNTTYHINQSNILQDTINIALAIFNNKEFKAISGSNEVEGYCAAPLQENAAFKSNKVNKLGKLGIGYNRINDSEKKILEEINKQIQENNIKDYGDIVLYSKWEPCPSCYYVIWQFLKKYPKINMKVKYYKKYGE